MPKDLVVKSYEIVEARYHLTPTETKLIALLTSRIEISDKEFATHTFKVLDLIKLLGMGKDNYDDVRIITKNLMKKVLEISADGKLIQVAFLSSAVYHENKGVVELRFDPLLKPYLLELKERFIKYKIDQVLQLSSFYSIRFYELLIKWEKIGKFTITVDQLRELFNISKQQYPKYANIKQKILLRAHAELYEKADLYFDFREIKTIRKVTAIEFLIMSKTNRQRQLNQASMPIEPDSPLDEKNESKTIIEEINNCSYIEESHLIKDEKLKDFVCKNNVSIKIIENLKSTSVEKHNIPDEQYETYLIYLMEHCESQINIQSISGFFVTLLKSGQFADNFLYKINDDKNKANTLESNFYKIYREKIEKYYYDDEISYIKTYLIENTEILYSLIDKNRAKTVFAMALEKNGRNVDLNLLENKTLLNILRPDVITQPNYSFISFADWQKNWEADPLNNEIIEKSKREAKLLIKV